VLAYSSAFGAIQRTAIATATIKGSRATNTLTLSMNLLKESVGIDMYESSKNVQSAKLPLFRAAEERAGERRRSL